MSVTVARAQPSIAGVGDYIELMKPRVMSLVVFTALVGLVVAPVPMHPVLAFTALLCIAIGAGAAGALNMWYDADIDARMARTAARPIPAGRLARGEALAFGLTLAGFSVVVLGLLVNIFAALLLAARLAFTSASIRSGSNDGRRRISSSAAPPVRYRRSSAGRRQRAVSRSSRCFCF